VYSGARDSSVGIANSYVREGSVFQPQLRRDFLAVQTAPRPTHSFQCNEYRVSLAWLKLPGRGIDQPCSSCVQNKKIKSTLPLLLRGMLRRVLYFYFAYQISAESIRDNPEVSPPAAPSALEQHRLDP
jgi:hypothetical protein